MYSADLTGGGLLLDESRVVSELLLAGVPADGLGKEIMRGNLLQKRSPASAKRLLSLLGPRLAGLDPASLRFIASGGASEVSLFLLAVCSGRHRILGDFLRFIRRECIDQYRTAVTREDWNHYFARCLDADPDIEAWTEATRKKLGSTVLAMLANAGVTERGTGILLPLYFPPELTDYLAAPGHENARALMEGLLS